MSFLSDTALEAAGVSAAAMSSIAGKTPDMTAADVSSAVSLEMIDLRFFILLSSINNTIKPV